MLKRACQAITGFGLLILVLVSPVAAFQSGGKASLSFVPASATASPGRDFKVDVVLSSDTQPITGVAIRVTYDAPSPNDLNVVSILPNASLGWMFPVQSSVNADGQTVIDIVGLTTEPTGYTVNGEVKIATLTLRSTTAFTAKQLTFDTSQTQVLRKADAVDVLGKVTGVSLTASGQASATPAPPIAVESIIGDEDVTAVPVPSVTPQTEIIDSTPAVEAPEEVTAETTPAPVSVSPALPSRNRLIAAALVLGLGLFILVLVGYLYRRSGKTVAAGAKSVTPQPIIPTDVPKTVMPPTIPDNQPPTME